MADLKVELTMKNDEIHQLRVQTESLERIRKVMGTPGDVLNKACFFDNNIKTNGQLSTAKIILILVGFTRKMEVALVDIRKLVSGSSIGPSQPPLPLETPQKEKQVEELRTPLQQRLIREVIAKVAKIEVPPTRMLAATPSTEKTKKEKDPSSKPSSQRRSSQKKTKEPL